MKDPDVRPKRVCSPKYAVQKARKGKKLNRWELEELAKDPEQSLIYAERVLKGRFPEAEPAIALNHEVAYAYAKGIIKGRFPEAEQAFLANHSDWGSRNYLQRYFIEVARERNPVVEKKIIETHHGLASKYAELCMNGRWAEAEPVILRDIDNAIEYHSRVVKDRWPELEDAIILKKKTGFWDNQPKSLSKYLEVVGRPVPEIEEKLERSNKASLLLTYAVRGMKGRLPPTLHQKMMMLGFDPKKQKIVKKYVKFLENCERRALAYIAGLDEEARKELFEKSGAK
jgi:hypothetical protein